MNTHTHTHTHTHTYIHITHAQTRHKHKQRKKNTQNQIRSVTPARAHLDVRVLARLRNVSARDDTDCLQHLHRTALHPSGTHNKRNTVSANLHSCNNSVRRCNCRNNVSRYRFDVPPALQHTPTPTPTHTHTHIKESRDHNCVVAQTSSGMLNTCDRRFAAAATSAM